MSERPDIANAVAKVQAGSVDDFEVIIEAFHVPVRAFIASWVAGSGDVDDLAQQTFVFAYQHIHEFSAGSNCPAWLRAIARNTTMAYLRRQKQKAEQLDKYGLQEVVNRAIENLPETYPVESAVALGNCVEKLPPEQYEFLRTVHRRRTTLEQVAEALGLTGATIRKRVSRLHQTLRDCIERSLKNHDLESLTAGQQP